MSVTDRTAPSQTDSISFELDLHHAPEKVWRAITDPELLAEWLLPVVDRKLALDPGAAFKPEQKQSFGGARYGWKRMGGKLVDLLARLP